MKTIEKCLKEMISWVKTSPRDLSYEPMTFNNIVFLGDSEEGTIEELYDPETDIDIEIGTYNRIKYVRGGHSFAIERKNKVYNFSYMGTTEV